MNMAEINKGGLEVQSNFIDTTGAKPEVFIVEGSNTVKPNDIDEQNAVKPTKPSYKPPEHHPLAPYLNFIQVKSQVRQLSPYNCNQLADDIFGSVKSLPMNGFFLSYFMKTGASSKNEAQQAINNNKDALEQLFRMLVGTKRNTITKSMFLNKLKKDGICPSISIMPIKSKYQMQGETQTCGIRNKNNIINVLVIVLILLAIFYFLNKKKK